MEEKFFEEAARAELWHEFMLAGARLVPRAPAVVEQDEDGGEPRLTTFRELEEGALAYRDALEDIGVGVGARVVVRAEVSGEALALLLACSMVGAAFVPVSPHTPEERLAAITETAQPTLVLRTEGLPEGRLPSGPAQGTFAGRGIRIEAGKPLGSRVRTEVLPVDTAYIIFTSGTTGRPKGVVMSHRAVLAFYRGMLEHGVAERSDRVGVTSPLQFDFSLLGMGLALGSGAPFVPVPREAQPWPRRLIAFLESTEVTLLVGVPSLLRSAVVHEPEGMKGLSHLRTALYSGEEFPVQDLRELRRLRPGMRIVNCFGSTESMAASFTDVPDPIPDDLERMPIGRAHRGAEMVLFDENGEPVTEPGVTGEIHLYTPALFSGYWNDPDTTRAARVPDPLAPGSGTRVLRTGDLAYRSGDGQLHFVGRADAQVQVGGNRVELSEVEAVLGRHPGIAGAAAVLSEGVDELSAFVVHRSGQRAPGAGELRSLCSRWLPQYMVPGRIEVVDALPLTANGKLDRRALRDR